MPSLVLFTVLVHLLLIVEYDCVETRENITIGGLFPVHSDGTFSESDTSIHVRESDKDSRCGELLLDSGIQRLEAMLYAIDEINKNQSYWKFTLEPILFDTCASDSYALEQSLQFLQYSCGPNTQISKKVTAVIGASHSQVSSAVANIFGLFRIPQVSYASSSEDLDDIMKYPYFFRVVPSDRFQIEVILDILNHFKWSYVSLVVSNSKYGETAAQRLQDQLRHPSQDVCLARVEKIPRAATESDYIRTIRQLSKTEEARVVILFLNEDKVRKLLDAYEKIKDEGHQLYWIGSDGWGAKDSVIKEREDLAEFAITMLPKRFPIEGFDDYFTNLKPTPETIRRNPWFKEFWETKFKCLLPGEDEVGKVGRCTGAENNADRYRQEGMVPMVVDSVHLVATAIQSLCELNPRFCDDPDSRERDFRDSLVGFIQNSTFQSSQGNGMLIQFDESRSVPVNYTVYQFRMDQKSGKFSYQQIAEWNPSDRLKMQSYVTWRRNEKIEDVSEVPLSRCSAECKRGEERIPNPNNKRCCWNCRPCDDMSIIPDPRGSCQKCEQGQIPNEDKNACIDIEAQYIGKDLGNPWALVPMFFSILGLICTTAVFVIFFLNRKTPIIMASGRELCYFILAGIVFCYCFPFVILLRPTEISCGILRITMGLGLSVCYSAIFTKTNRISRIFEVSMKITKRPSYISPESQIIICICLVLIQVTLTAMWLIVRHPAPDLEKGVYSAQTWELVCVLDGMSMALGLAYNMVLLILCTVYAYKTRNIPENFNETKWISFTMYLSCIIWLAFIPIFCSGLQDYKVQATILSMSVSFSGTVTLVCIFLPKLYIVLFHPERNVRYPSSSATSGTGTENSQPVRFVKASNTTLGAPTPPQRADSPFLFPQKPDKNLAKSF